MNNTTLNLLAMANDLEVFVAQCVPDCVRVSKYGGTLFTLKPEQKEGQFCGVFLHTKHVQLSFAQGASLDDPDEILLGTGKYRRHLKLSEPNDVPWDAIRALITQASRL